jgi:hypothetical protein
MRVNIQRWHADGVATSYTWQRGPLIQSLASDVTAHPDQRVCITAPALCDASLANLWVSP